MRKTGIYFLVGMALGACGGSSGGSDEPVASAYLEYMKSAYSDTVGENSEDSNSRNLVIQLDAASILPSTSPDPTENTAFDAFSETNVQIAGVDEASPLKFDGSHLLALGNTFSEPRVLNLNRDTLMGLSSEDVSLHFEPETDFNYVGLLKNGDYAALVGYKNFWYPYNDWLAIDSRPICLACSTQQEIKIYTWRYKQDGVSLAPQPEEITIDGSFNSVRLIDDKLYLVSLYSPVIDDLILYPSTAEEAERNQTIINALELADVSPRISIGGNAQTLIKKDCAIPPVTNNYRYQPQVVSITQVDIDSPAEWQSSCLTGEINGAFFSRENIYLSRWRWGDNETEIIKYSTSSDDGAVYQARGRVEGSLSYDSYFFGEVDGHLIYVNTVYDQQQWWESNDRHQLSVLEQNGDALELIAQLPNENNPAPIGKPGEQIYAVRIIDRRAYIVTFDKVDPLYVIDLTEPSTPEILGELEIPGFSSYIHPINDDLLIGIGKNAVVYQGTAWFQGLNVRLFDVSEPTNPIALVSLDYGYRGSFSPALNNPHSFTYAFDEDNQRFRFTLPMQLNGNSEVFDPSAPPNTYYDVEEFGLYQFEVTTDDNPTLSESGRYLMESTENGYSTALYSVIDGDLIYILHNDSVDVIDWGGTSVLRQLGE